METEYYVKKANQREVNNIKFLESIGKSYLLPLYKEKEGKIYYVKEKVMPVAAQFETEWFYDFYDDILIDLYEEKSKKYSPGIYSYIESGDRNDGSDISYIGYLQKEFVTIVNNNNILKDDCCSKLRVDLFEFVLSAFETFNQQQIEQFTLLHGDFHLGNVLYSYENKRFHMIDVEYLRYGLPEMEIANFCVQLLDGGKYVLNDYEDILKEIINNDRFGNMRKNLITDLFMPLLLFFRLWRSETGVNIKQTLVLNTVTEQVKKVVYDNIYEGIVDNPSIEKE